ncbi:MAG: hypothetical protein AAF223_00250 [Bacteroidota bacterium]
MNHRLLKALILALLILNVMVIATVLSQAQHLMLDPITRAGDLTLLSDYQNPNEFYYVVDQPQIAQDEQGNLRFQFMKYAKNTNKGVIGGGIVKVVISLSVSDEQIQEAEREIRRTNPQAIIKGPAMWREGTVALHCNLTQAKGKKSRKVLGVGNAPILDEQQTALSFQLDQLGAEILWESFQNPTPDVSIAFEMKLDGYRPPLKAKIEANFDQIYEHESFKAGVATPMLTADIHAAFDELRESKAITISQWGADGKMESIIDKAYAKLIDMMFKPAKGSGAAKVRQTSAARGGTSMSDRAQALRNGGAKPKPGRPGRPETEASKEEGPPSIAIAAAYELKKERHKGSFSLDLSKSMLEKLNYPFSGEFGSELVGCETCFHKVNLDDPLFQQRSIVAFVDGLNAEDFGEYINFVSVTLKKEHQGGAATLDEVRIDRNNFNREGNNFTLLYGWKDDPQREQWLDYHYQTVWSFFGGVTLEVPEQSSQATAINLAPPFQRKRVSLEADPELLKEAEVRLVNVKVFYKLGGKAMTKQVTINIRQKPLGQVLEFMLPADELEYEYEIEWIAAGNQVYKSGREKTSMDILLIDNIPLFQNKTSKN